jgi:hypothetical protein
MNAAELKIADPKRFDKRYYEWCAHALDYEWWDYTVEMFTEDCAPKGVEVVDTSFSNPGSAGFEGWVNVAVFMERSGLAEKYPALYLGVTDDGGRATVSLTRNSNMRVSYDSYVNQTAPSGMFSGLDQATWEELIESQEAEADLESAIQKYCNDLGNELHTMLRNEEEYLTSEESYIEYCAANDITFETEEDYETNC